MISIRHLKKVYPNVTPLVDVNAEIRRGEIISIIGPSGTGKSTLLRCINRLEKPTSGEIIIDGKSITAPGANVPLLRRKMGMVFQSFNLFNHLTVVENVMVAQQDILHRTQKEAFDKAMDLLHKVGLVDKADNLPEELSGGQKQRVAIARTLAMDPEIVLFDEPTSALDPTMVGEVLTVIRNLAKQGLTMLIVTHEMKFAKDISTRIFYMDEGVIYEDGTPEQVFNNSMREKTRQFIKRLKIFEEKISKGNFEYTDFMNRLYRFAEKNQVAAKMIRNLFYVFEEFVLQSLLPSPSIEGEILFTVEYSGENEWMMAKFEYSGERFNAFETFDDVSRKFMELAVSKMDFNYDNGKNCLELCIR